MRTTYENTPHTAQGLPLFKHHMPRWETNGVFFALNQTIHSTGKVSYARFHMLFGFPPVSGRESVPLVCPRCRLGLPAHNTST